MDLKIVQINYLTLRELKIKAFLFLQGMMRERLTLFILFFMNSEFFDHVNKYSKAATNFAQIFTLILPMRLCMFIYAHWSSVFHLL